MGIFQTIIKNIKKEGRKLELKYLWGKINKDMETNTDFEKSLISFLKPRLIKFGIIKKEQ